MGQTTADVPGLIPEGMQLPPARKGERALARRRQAAAYALLTPGALYLLIGFVVPLVIIVITSLSSGGGLFSSGGQTTFTWEFSNYSTALSQNWQIYVRSVVFAGIATVLCIGLAYPMAYWIAFYGGKWKSTLFMLILVPFFVSFVIRTVQWNFILGTNGLLFGPLKSAGIISETFYVLKTRVAVIAGITYTTCRSPRCRCSSPWIGSTAGSSRRRRISTPRTRWPSARSCCRCRSPGSSPR
jgi:spermidine/putrescine transport system permease protein